jgi:hypothetical protein
VQFDSRSVIRRARARRSSSRARRHCGAPGTRRNYIGASESGDLFSASLFAADAPLYNTAFDSYDRVTRFSTPIVNDDLSGFPLSDELSPARAKLTCACVLEHTHAHTRTHTHAQAVRSKYLKSPCPTAGIAQRANSSQPRARAY